MTCLEMYNNSCRSHQPSPPPPPSTLSPRISFSNDFIVESQPQNSSQRPSEAVAAAPPSTDFEFTISNNDMITTAADELFFKGRLLPFKPSNNTQHPMQRTLRDQLLHIDDDEDQENGHDHGDNNVEFSLKPNNKDSSSPNIWKGFLGLRKSYISPASKKPEKNDGFAFAYANQNASSPKEVMSTGNPCNTDMEMGI